MDNPIFARFLTRYGERTERWGNTELRAALLTGLTGRVLEVGTGTGLNFRHYPATVTSVTAVEPEPFLREQSAKAASLVDVPIELVDAVADDLPAENESFDAIVVTGVLCSVPDLARALAEFRRVLRPGGELRFYEHVLSRSAPFAHWQRLMTPVWSRAMGGCHADRDTLGAIRAARFEIQQAQGLIYPHWAKASVVSSRVRGTALRL